MLETLESNFESSTQSERFGSFGESKNVFSWNERSVQKLQSCVVVDDDVSGCGAPAFVLAQTSGRKKTCFGRARKRGKDRLHQSWRNAALVCVGIWTWDE